LVRDPEKRENGTKSVVKKKKDEMFARILKQRQGNAGEETKWRKRGQVFKT